MTEAGMTVEVVALEELRRLAMLVEYEGTRYHGFQLQRNGRSIQEELEVALQYLTGEQTRVRGAGRTDAGVHAQGQVVAFDTWATHSPSVLLRALNYYLPEEISVREVREVSLDFDPRRWAVSREYRYQILNSATPSPLLRRNVHLVKRPLNTTAMDEAARLLEGARDCAPFSGPLPAERSTTWRRVDRCTVRREGDLVTLDMVANGFLPQQVRRTAGALLDVGLGRTTVQRFNEIADNGIRGAFTKALPPKGLCLMRVNYPDGLFANGRDAAERMTLEAGVR